MLVHSFYQSAKLYKKGGSPKHYRGKIKHIALQIIFSLPENNFFPAGAEIIG